MMTEYKSERLLWVCKKCHGPTTKVVKTILAHGDLRAVPVAGDDGTVVIHHWSVTKRTVADVGVCWKWSWIIHPIVLCPHWYILQIYVHDASLHSFTWNQQPKRQTFTCIDNIRDLARVAYCTFIKLPTALVEMVFLKLLFRSQKCGREAIFSNANKFTTIISKTFSSQHF